MVSCYVQTTSVELGTQFRFACVARWAVAQVQVVVSTNSITWENLTRSGSSRSLESGFGEERERESHQVRSKPSARDNAGDRRIVTSCVETNPGSGIKATFQDGWVLRSNINRLPGRSPLTGYISKIDPRHLSRQFPISGPDRCRMMEWLSGSRQKRRAAILDAYPPAEKFIKRFYWSRQSSSGGLIDGAGISRAAWQISRSCIRTVKERLWWGARRGSKSAGVQHAKASTAPSQVLLQSPYELGRHPHSPCIFASGRAHDTYWAV